MKQNFLLVGCEAAQAPVRDGSGAVRHFMQQTGYTCGAASLSMITGLTEEKCRHLARTTRRGTFDHDALAGLRAAGFDSNQVLLDAELNDVLPELILQSHRWPLYLSLEFKHEGRDSRDRRRRFSRHHACVLAGGRFLDPAQFHELDAEALGHLSERGIRLKGYILVEA